MLRYALFPGCNISLSRASIWPSYRPENPQVARLINHRSDARHTNNRSLRDGGSDLAPATRCCLRQPNGQSQTARGDEPVRWWFPLVRDGGDTPHRRRPGCRLARRHVPLGAMRRAEPLAGRTDLAPHRHTPPSPTRRQVGSFRWQGSFDPTSRPTNTASLRMNST